MIPEGAIISGVISKIINDGVDVSKSAIKREIENRTANSRNIQSQIYQVIINALNEITSNQYKDNQDIIYEASENLLKAFKNSRGGKIEAVRAGSGVLGLVSNEKCEEFIKLLCHEISKDDYSELYREISLLQQEQESSRTLRIEQKVDGVNQKIEEKLNEVNQKLNYIKQDDKKDTDIMFQGNVQQKVKSRTQEYADKWNENMFLNDFDKRNENAGVNIKLREVYLESHLPHYFFMKNENTSSDLKALLTEYIDQNTDDKMLLILGQPGIGKSTLITWITANFTDNIDNILVYKFVSDLKNIDWEKADIVEQILDALSLSYDDLEGKTLILDGFDEINIGGDRKEILDKLYWQFIRRKFLKKISLIITCRENCVAGFERVRCTYIRLQAWNEEQIKSFCSVFQKKVQIDLSEYTVENVLKNKEILGIPLILYMVLALNISIEKEGSIVDIYDRIFALDDGIYDRCIGYEEPHRIEKIKKQIHEISKRIAIWMFENNPDGANISQTEYQKICADIIRENKLKNENLMQDFLIGNYFRLVRHCEGVEAEELCFVHRSIYEYFVAVHTFDSIYDKIQVSQEKLACVLGKIFKQGVFSFNMIVFLQHKIMNSELKNKFSIVHETFQMMLRDGMTYYIGECCKNAIDCEMNIFTNMLEIIHCWDKGHSLEFDDTFCNYLRYNKYYGLNLNGVILKSGKDEYENGMLNLNKPAYLSRVNLREADLRRANLSGADLTKADLGYAKLTGANFSGANFSGANLNGVDFGGADLSGANFAWADLINCLFQQFYLVQENRISYENRANLTGADFTGAIIDNLQIVFLEKCNLNIKDVRVYLKETNEIVSYQEYCRKREKGLI